MLSIHDYFFKIFHIGLDLVHQMDPESLGVTRHVHLAKITSGGSRLDKPHIRVDRLDFVLQVKAGQGALLTHRGPFSHTSPWLAAMSLRFYKTLAQACG